MILVDTSVWIEYLRAPGSPAGQELNDLLSRKEAAITGAIMVEIIQGVRSKQEVAGMQGRLSQMPYLELDKGAWLRAGELSYVLRRQGLAMPMADIVIAAVALGQDVPVFSLDKHFESVPGLRLHVLGQES